MTHLLSKSKYIRGLQCERALWLDVHEPRLARYTAVQMRRLHNKKRMWTLLWQKKQIQYIMATMTISYDGRSSVMKHLIEAMLAAGAKMLSSSEADVEFYSDKKALRSFKQSVEQEKKGMAREVSLDDVKQMLCL